jgi:glycosyltransferase involved in cell wall biosynthesis
MQVPFVSIIIPSYNSASYISRLMDSLLSQTYTNWEAIIVDNNSKDDTIDLLKKYADSRIKIFTINNEGVIAKSRNLGISKSQGEWIAFLDSDDWWESDKLEMASAFFEDNVDLIYHKLVIAYDKNLFSKKSLYYRKVNNVHKELLIHGNFIPNSSVMIRSSIIRMVGKISENTKLVGSEDYNYLLKITNQTQKIKFIDKKLGYYYMNPNGVSRKRMSISHKEAISEFLKNCLDTELKVIRGHIAYMDAKFLILNSDFKDAQMLLIEAIKKGTMRIKLRALSTLLKLLFSNE